jgi:hypothetical protein
VTPSSVLSATTNACADIDEEWLARSLSNVYPGTADAVAAAVPVLWKILVHHGTYPFKPPKTTQLTILQTANAAAFLTARDEISVREPTGPHVVRRRHRNWNDRRRLLFQSMCNTNWSQAASKDVREREDDEDLVAALEGPPRQDRKTAHPVFDMAKKLPSSHSRKLDGRVALRDLRALLALVIVTSTGSAREDPSEEKTAAERAVLALLGDFPDPEGCVTWEEFRHLTACEMVRNLFLRHGFTDF